LEEKKQIPGLKYLNCRKYSFQVPDDSDSNIRGFFWRDTCVSPSQLNKPIWRQKSQGPL
jgi:hypothetical protein